jgi:Reverse transcriptase (RNA-dependent DNA polymerase).
VYFITDYLKVNKLIKRKPYPLPCIANTLQELEGLQFALALDLNMGYYTIWLTPGAKDLTTIVTKFGKFCYNALPMGMCCSGEIFQAKVLDQLLGNIEGVKTHIDDILVISKGSFNDHLKQLDTCFVHIQETGLKVKADKCSFGLSEFLYLGYIISHEGIKPDPKKIQGIVDLKRPQTTTEARAIISSIQLYKNIW